MLLELIEKGADHKRIPELLAFAGGRLMAAEADQLTAAAAGVRSPDRIDHCNVHRECGRKTRVGRIELAIPKLRPAADRVAFRAAVEGLLAFHG